jgi:prolyl-tRNA editing enzyme YbaK/EbsC (Cys-tRNA(Pro) deacylase)
MGCGYAHAVAARTWPEDVERVAAYLREGSVEARVEEFAEPTKTAEDAARAVGCSLGQIVKSLVFDCDDGAIVVLIPGDRRADRQKIAAAAGCGNAKIAGPDRVREVTGFEPGAVAPFPLPNVKAVYVDRNLLGHRVVWIGAGSTRHVAGLTPADLARLSHARPVDAVEAGEG